jgi:hypothetical protein
MDFELRVYRAGKQRTRITDVGPDVEDMASLKEIGTPVYQTSEWIFQVFFVEEVRIQKDSLTPRLLQRAGRMNESVNRQKYFLDRCGHQS